MYDEGFFSKDGRWLDETGTEQECPYPIGARVVVRTDLDGEYLQSFDSGVGTVRQHAWADDFSFRVEFPNGEWGKFASWEIAPAP